LPTLSRKRPQRRIRRLGAFPANFRYYSYFLLKFWRRYFHQGYYFLEEKEILDKRRKKRLTMNGYCPNCEKEIELQFIEKVEEINIRGEIIPIKMEYYHCEKCGADFEIPRANYDPLDTAYREYRRRKGMVQPEEIKRFRKELSLSQKELSEILGIGMTTLNLYENGALQSRSQDHEIRLCMESTNLLKLLKKKPELLSQETRDRIYQLNK
jgi:putative zinc finger/helix-turn-helix YgiT family protein